MFIFKHKITDEEINKKTKISNDVRFDYDTLKNTTFIAGSSREILSQQLEKLYTPTRVGFYSSRELSEKVNRWVYFIFNRDNDISVINFVNLFKVYVGLTIEGE